MIIIIPLGGRGERFKKLGYKQPKALIHVFGKPILFWLLDSIKDSIEDTHIIIPYNQEYVNYRLEGLLKKNLVSTISLKLFKILVPPKSL